jgi:hypothetical protein
MVNGKGGSGISLKGWSDSSRWSKREREPPESLCDLGELCVSVVDLPNKTIHHRDTEATEDAQRKTFSYVSDGLGRGVAGFSDTRFRVWNYFRFYPVVCAALRPPATI